MEKKLLIAVDGSVYSTNTLHYIEQLFAHLDDIRLHLLAASRARAGYSRDLCLNR